MVTLISVKVILFFLKQILSADWIQSIIHGQGLMDFLQIFKTLLFQMSLLPMPDGIIFQLLMVMDVRLLWIVQV